MAEAEKTCLVVDDSATIRRVLSGMLHEFGYDVSEAPSGVEAVETCRDHAPGLIFLDWNMPEMDGITCLKALRAMEIAPRPVIVLCTTENSLAKIHEALTAGADEYIMKPFDREILQDKLEQLGLCDVDAA
jgi:two-component system chemotaxis response regulator CheY